MDTEDKKKIKKLGSDQIVQLLELYREYEPLYNVRHAKHKDRNYTDASLKELSRRAVEKGIHITDIRKQLKGLRDTYREAKKKCMCRSGMDAEDSYKPTLPWFDVADAFLGSYVTIRTTTDSVSTPSASHYDEPSPDVFSDSTPAISTTPVDTDSTSTNKTSRASNKRVKRSTLATSSADDKTTTDGFLVQLAEIREQAALEAKKDTSDHFGSMVATELRSLSRLRQIAARREIHNVLLKYAAQDELEGLGVSVEEVEESFP